MTSLPNVKALDPWNNPIPNDCGICGAPSQYGLDGRWYCSSCWQRAGLGLRPRESDPA